MTIDPYVQWEFPPLLIEHHPKSVVGGLFNAPQRFALKLRMLGVINIIKHFLSQSGKPLIWVLRISKLGNTGS